MRARYGGEDELRAKQRSVVAAFVEVCPGGGWAADDVMGQYAASALQTHMSEALLADPLDDTVAQSWSVPNCYRVHRVKVLLASPRAG